MKKISTFALIATLFSTATFAASPESKDTAKDTANEPTFLIEQTSLLHRQTYTKKKCLSQIKQRKYVG